MGTIEKTKDVLKQAGNAYFSDTPKWAKIVRFAGLALGAIGGAILTANPVTMPVGLVVAAPYLTVVGNAAALFVQGFKK
jgi:hypothetical protein